jgi:glycosyltransferase involved in cell wall biosynthesis
VPRLLIANNYWYRRGGADVAALEQAALFRRRGWEVAEFAMRHPSNQPSAWDHHFVDEIELGHRYGPARQVLNAGRVVWSGQARRRLAALVDEARPDVAHLHNVYHHISPAIIPLLARRGVPVVLTTHDLKLACPAYQMLSDGEVCQRCRDGGLRQVVRHRCLKGSLALSSLVFVESGLHRALGTYARHVDRFVTPSRFYLRLFAEWGFDPEKFVHVPNAVDVDAFEADPRPGRHVVYAGRLAPEKGVHTLLRAAAASATPVLVLGTGPAEADLRRVAAEAGTDVTWGGHRSGGALHDAIRSARATVLPSEWFENAPMSILESYALGTPVVGARIGGIEELVRDGETGRTFPSGDVDALAAVLRELAVMPDGDVADLGRTGRRWVEDDFGLEQHAARLESVYADLGVKVPVPWG